MVAPLTGLREIAGLDLSASPTAGWMDGVARVNSIAGGLRPPFRALVRRIGGEAAFATLWESGRPVAYGCAVMDGGMVGLFEIVVAAGCRGRGYGRAITTGLMHWGQAAGAGSAYLQVVGANGVARGLYDNLGFTERYAYHYRVRQGV